MQCPEVSIYCEVNMTNLTAILRKDEYVVNPDDPCSMYKCIGPGELQHKVVECQPITNCTDGKAPYFLPGSCCLTCREL